MRINDQDVWKGPSARAALWVLTAAAILAVAGGPALGADSAFARAFSHRRHAEEDLKCEACHPGAAKAEQAGVPSAKSCQKCHEGIDAKLPAEHRLAAYLVSGELPPLHVTDKLPADVKFSHKAHADGRVQCATCHKDVGSSKSLASRVGMDMKDCRKCHSEVQNVSGLKNDCAFCHKTISREWKPLDHQANWKSLHGKAIGFMTKDATQRCETCHTQAWCLSCHRQEKPASHTNFWRDRGHNVMAELDRQGCRTCHTGDFCVRCHRASAPNVLFRRVGVHRTTTSIGRCEDCHFEGAGRLAPHRNPGTTHCLQCHRIVGG